MGLMLGPVGLVGAYLVTYMLHGVGGAPHATLLHREASARNRATVLSMNSMVMQAGGAVAAPAIGWLAADHLGADGHGRRRAGQRPRRVPLPPGPAPRAHPKAEKANA